MTTFRSSFVSVTTKPDTGEVTALIPGATVEIVYPNGQSTYSYASLGVNLSDTGYDVDVEPLPINLTINGQNAFAWNGGTGP